MKLMSPGRSGRKSTGAPILSRIAAASAASSGESTTRSTAAPSPSIARLSTLESWRSRPEVAEGGERRPGIVAREGRANLAAAKVLRGEVPRPQLFLLRHLQRDEDVLGEVDPRQVLEK